MNQPPTIIEVDGVKITPELVQLLKKHIDFERKSVSEIKNDLFYVSNMLVTLSNNEHIDFDGAKIGESMYTIYTLFGDIEELLIEGKI